MNAPTTFPTNLPALIDALPADSTRPQQTEFTRERQVAFLSALANGGAVRRAVKAAGVAHQTAYRMRRASPAFRRAWDAALLAARAQAEDVLACRALEGVEEAVYYHGEEVATRRRYDSRLLLAHLARLDRLTADARTNAFAEDFEAALDRFARGEEQPEPDTATTSAHPEPVEGCSRQASVLRQAQHERSGGGRGEADFSSSGQCNNRSMSPHGDDSAAPPGEDEYDPDREPSSWLDDPRYLRWPNGSHRHRIRPPGYPEWEEDMDDPAHWRDGVYIPPLGRRLHAMEAARPEGAREPHELRVPGCDGGDIEAEQLAAFEAGVERWWLVVPSGEGEDTGEWCYAGE